MTATTTTQTAEETRLSEQVALTKHLGMESSSATYIARTLDLASPEDFGPQARILASAYGVELADIESIHGLFGRSTPAAAAAV